MVTPIISIHDRSETLAPSPGRASQWSMVGVARLTSRKRLLLAIGWVHEPLGCSPGITIG
jgi:hypothetical protein